MIPITKARSAIRVTRNALTAARRALSRRVVADEQVRAPAHDLPPDEGEHEVAGRTTSSIAAGKSETVAANAGSGGRSRRYQRVYTWTASATTATTTATAAGWGRRAGAAAPPARRAAGPGRAARPRPGSPLDRPAADRASSEGRTRRRDGDAVGSAVGGWSASASTEVRAGTRTTAGRSRRLCARLGEVDASAAAVEREETASATPISAAAMVMTNSASTCPVPSGSSEIGPAVTSSRWPR